MFKMELKGSQTEKNLLAAFAGESQARNRYTYFASVARKEGMEQISAIFAETADNEKEHAQLFFSRLQGGDAQITASYPAGITGTTAENLKAAAAGEKLEWTTLYPGFGEVAEKEGFKDIAGLFRRVASVETTSRAQIPEASQQSRSRSSVQAAHCRQVEVPQLRPHLRRQGRPREVSSVPAREGVLRTLR